MYKPFLTRLSIFLFLFICVSGFIGPWVINTRLLYGFYFFIYGNLGKLVLFSSIAFFLYAKKNILQVPISSYKIMDISYILLACTLIPVFFHLAGQLLLSPSPFQAIPLLLLTHIVLLLIPLLLLIGVFSPFYLWHFLARFKRELVVCLLLALCYDLAIFYIWRFWNYLSNTVLYVVYALFSLTFPTTAIVPPLGLFVKNFTVEIEESCSGLDSIFLFTSLYILIGLIDWKQLNKRKLFFLFFPVLFGLFLVNIIRVYLLIWIGVLFGPQITLLLFHTYLGMVLFIGYFLLFLWRFYGWLKR